MRVTVVPNRNAIMLAIAFGVAAAERADAVAARGTRWRPFHISRLPPAFGRNLRSDAASRAGRGGEDLLLHAVLAHEQSRHRARGREGLKSPLPKPGSLLQGRRSALRFAAGPASSGVRPFTLPAWDDPTPYEDPDYWVEACRKHRARHSHRVRPMYIIAKRFTFSGIACNWRPASAAPLRAASRAQLRSRGGVAIGHARFNRLCPRLSRTRGVQGVRRQEP